MKQAGNQRLPAIDWPRLAFPAGMKVENGEWFTRFILAFLPRSHSGLRKSKRPGIGRESECFHRADVIPPNLVAAEARSLANMMKKWPPEPAECAVIVGAAVGGAGGDGEEAGAVVVGEFEDEVEAALAKEGGEFEVGHPVTGFAFGGVGVRCREDVVDLRAAGQNAVAGFTHEHPNLGLRELLLGGDEGGCEQERISDVAEFDEEDSHAVLRRGHFPWE